MNDDDRDPEHSVVLVAETVAALREIGRAKATAYQRDHIKTRVPARLSQEQLAEAYKRTRMRNPREPISFAMAAE